MTEQHPMLKRVARYMMPALDEIEPDARVGELTAREVIGLARAALTALLEPSNDAWDGLARQIVMWMDFGQPTPRRLFKHLTASGFEVPQWLRDEPEMRNLDHVPSKGTRAMLIFTAMIQQILTDSDGSPEGRDAHAARSRSDESAGRKASAQAQPTTTATTKGEG